MKLLITSPKFFGYEKAIVKEASSLGYEVYFFDDRFGLSFIEQAFLRKNIFANSIREKTYRNLKKKISTKEFDIWLCINPEAIDERCIKLISNHISNSNILYLWDNIKNKPNFKSLLNHFNTVLTFDLEDSLKFKLMHVPLYYTKEYYFDNPKSKENKIFTIGSIHSDRIHIMKKLEHFGFDIKFKIFSKNVFLTFYNLIIGVVPFSYLNKISYKPLTHTEISSIYKKYSFILDISHPNQSGLTNRTFEVLASGCFLITTNSNIIKYDFYNPDYIFILDRENLNFKDLKYWMKSRENKQFECDMGQYSLSSWINTVMSVSNVFKHSPSAP